MSAALRKPMGLDEFLAWEARQEERYEYDGFGPVAMTGGTLGHELIGGNIRAELCDRLRGKRCTVVGPTLKIEVAGRIRYPDAFVRCGPGSLKDTVFRDPVVVFEVSSSGSTRVDRVDKLREYARTPSIQRYVLLEQDSIAAQMFVRKGDLFVSETLTEGDILSMPEIEVELPFAVFYAGLDFPDDDSAPVS
jgi:Uma2 family endonuclease